MENNGHLNKQLPGYNLYTICNKMSNDISTDVQYIYTIKFVFFCFQNQGL